MSALQGVHRRHGSRLVAHCQYQQPQQYRQRRVAGESSLGSTRAERRLDRREAGPGRLGISLADAFAVFGQLAAQRLVPEGSQRRRTPGFSDARMPPCPRLGLASVIMGQPEPDNRRG